MLLTARGTGRLGSRGERSRRALFSVPPLGRELMIRMLIVGYCFGVRSERRLCEDVYLNLAYRWFCRLGLDGEVPDHSTFFKNRHGRFRECDLLRKLFETVVATRSNVLSRAHYPPPTPASR
jgi:hypothetical protein